MAESTRMGAEEITILWRSRQGWLLSGALSEGPRTECCTHSQGAEYVEAWEAKTLVWCDRLEDKTEQTKWFRVARFVSSCSFWHHSQCGIVFSDDYLES